MAKRESAVRVIATRDGRGCRLSVRAQPGAKRSGSLGPWNEHWKVALRAPAEKGRANEELLAVLADELGLRVSQLELVRGEHARLKEVFIALPEAEVRRRLLGDGENQA